MSTARRPGGRAAAAGLATVLLGVAAPVFTGRADASIKVAGNARQPALRVNAAGAAEVSWTSESGERRSLLIEPNGSLAYGGRLRGRDVSVPTGAVSIPVALVLRRTPDGSFWALQSWRRLADGPVELRFARWRGEPTTLTLKAVCCKWRSENVTGTASFQGRAIFGYHSTRQGVPLDPFGRNVFLDSYRDGHWLRMLGILTHRPTGFFSLWIRPPWRAGLYRGTMIGPNWGWTLGPDAQAETRSAL